MIADTNGVIKRMKADVDGYVNMQTDTPFCTSVNIRLNQILGKTK